MPIHVRSSWYWPYGAVSRSRAIRKRVAAPSTNWAIFVAKTWVTRPGKSDLSLAQPVRSIGANPGAVVSGLAGSAGDGIGRIYRFRREAPAHPLLSEETPLAERAGRRPSRIEDDESPRAPADDRMDPEPCLIRSNAWPAWSWPS